MSLVGPGGFNNKTSLTIQFNRQVSAKAYANARDDVLLMRGVSLVSEDETKRTMKVEIKNSALQSKIEDVAGVEKVEAIRQPYDYRNHRL